MRTVFLEKALTAMRKGAVFGLCFAITFFASSDVSAFEAPRARLVCQAVKPDCLVTGTSFLFDQSPGYGTFNKGPALLLKNACDTDIKVTHLYRSQSSFAADKNSGGTQVVLHPIQGEPRHTKEFIFFNADVSCPSGKKEFSFANVTSFFKEHLKSLLENKQGPRIECGSFVIPHASEAAIAMPWDTYYQISGFVGNA